jgi:hypothetical protein
MTTGSITLDDQKISSGDTLVKYLNMFTTAVGVTLSLPMSAQAAETMAKPAEDSAAPAKCLEAAVNPVTGDAVCVNPRGAPVEPPPKSAYQPCKPRAHDSDPFTVYEHASGCGD